MTISNVTFGYYANNLLTGTLAVTNGDELLPAAEMRLDFTIPAREGATQADITVVFWNMAGNPYAGAGYESLPVGVPVSITQPMVDITSNITYQSAPGTSRIAIQSVYLYDAEYNDVEAQEGLDHWDWYRSQADAPVGAVPAYVV